MGHAAHGAVAAAGPRLGRLSTGQRLDGLVLFVTAVLYAIAWPTLHVTHLVPAGVQPLIAGLAALPMVLIRANPALGWAISASGALVIPVVYERVGDYDFPWQVVHVMVLMALLFAVSLRSPVAVVAVAWAATAMLFLADAPGQDGRGWAVGLTVLVLFGLLIRWLVLSRRQLARQAEVTEVERARRAILEEKARIARDLHDVVAHHMSLVVVQAQSAPYRVESVSDEARAEFESIGATAREALNEVRGLLGVLRSDGAEVERAPQPGTAQIDELLDASVRAGISLSRSMTGDPAVISEAAGLTVYRILQESLANAARHCPGAHVEVALDYSSAVTSLVVTNGPATSEPSVGAHAESSGGSGIRGMRERARAVGGTLDTRPLDDGGFEVRAHIPGGSAAAVGVSSTTLA
ncbi:histidine kinase [Rhodococcus sp. ABRD24]|uniref:sensor histidine kinase n=1 Tax=Rhodococcus sp. ABRD24 TaxID=2507582 RepID=UPI001F61EBC6|nr:histidine kinase [Rhodococcus sp. ABRD24]